MKEGAAVLCYKPLATTDDNDPYLMDHDFVLIIMPETQVEILSRLGSDCICVSVLDNLPQGSKVSLCVSDIE